MPTATLIASNTDIFDLDIAIIDMPVVDAPRADNTFTNTGGDKTLTATTCARTCGGLTGKPCAC
jgi:hypothetical protein